MAMEVALWTCLEKKMYPDLIFTNCTTLVDLIYKDDQVVAWRYRERRSKAISKDETMLS